MTRRHIYTPTLGYIHVACRCFCDSATQAEALSASRVSLWPKRRTLVQISIDPLCFSSHSPDKPEHLRFKVCDWADRTKG